MTEKRNSKTSRATGKASATAPADDPLWREVTATTEPLKKKPAGRRTGSVDGDADRQSPADRSRPKTGGKAAGAADQPFRPAARSAGAKEKTDAPQSRFNRRQLRQIARGREEIEARLDLHGMRQHQAHQALKAFLLRAQRDGSRMVLVITGKGSAGQEGGTRRFGVEERGVLKRLVPQWLAETELSAFVAGYSPARPPHGGDGALYVRLRRAGRIKE